MRESLTNPAVIKRILTQYGFKFKKGLGQNFLIDSSVATDTIEGSGITKNTSVIEIGPGFGSLTQALLLQARDVTAVEIDNALEPVLTDLFGDNESFLLVVGDILKIDLNTLIKNQDTAVVANLPYYITTPIIGHLLESRYPLKSITVMVQREVADRFLASPGTKEYGAFTCLINYYADVKIIRHVNRECFMPQPAVDSAVVYLEILEKPRVAPKNEDMFFRVIKAAFSQRRKTLLNALANSGRFDSKQGIEKALRSVGINPQVRGETLSVFDFLKIADELILGE